MKPGQFQLHRPSTVSEVVGLLAELGDEAKVLAGGQSLIPVLALRLSRFEHLIDLNGVLELEGMCTGSEAVVLGAQTRHAQIAADPEIERAQPLLYRAARLIGHPAIRNRGTLGGSIAHADSAAELPAVAVALGAEIDVVGPAGRRTVDAGEFFLGTWTTALEPEEVVTAVTWPVWSGSCGWSVRELARRHGDFAVAGVVCGVSVTDGRVDRASVVLFGMGDVPIRAATAEQMLLSTAVADLELSEVGRAATQETRPTGDLHGSAEYRIAVAGRLAEQAIHDAIQEAVA